MKMPEIDKLSAAKYAARSQRSSSPANPSGFYPGLMPCRLRPLLAYPDGQVGKVTLLAIALTL
jgi:hypothetical protein